MRSRLMVISGPDRGRIITIPPEGGMVGRGDSCSMKLGDAAVSREHFRIGVRDGRPLVIDMGSTNRTVVNGEPVTMRSLSTGDRIEIGHSVIEVISEGEVACTGAGTVVHAEHDAEVIASTVGQVSGDPAFLAEALRAVSSLALGLPKASTVSAAAELTVTVLGRALGATRFQILRDSDGDRGSAFAVVAGKADEDDAPVGVVPLDRALLVKVAEQRRAVLASDGGRGALAVPLLIDSVPSLMVADRAGAGWDEGVLAVIAVAARALEGAIESLSRGNRADSEREGLVEIDGDSAVSARMREWVTWLAQRPEAALLVGPPGSGKERLAEAVHRRSPRAPGPFVVAHCAGLTESLVESELFGHEAQGGERKPGKLEQARGGTLFLDELAALPQRSQKRLARALDLGYLEKSSGGKTPLDVRIIAGSCADLMQAVQAGALRDDLYRKLAGQVMLVPALVERQGDIIGLAERFLYQLAAEAGQQRRSGFAPDAATRLAQHDWPGNVRELHNTVERLVIQGSTDPISLYDVERALVRRQ
ncbi:MAG TPA: sigma 54-interacting transcriptional regulator [Kofleriaceae bacterium]|nr:sigma 54-interacting transcriptional regulator [Kofleriaceae bacterium]